MIVIKEFFKRKQLLILFFSCLLIIFIILYFNNLSEKQTQKNDNTYTNKNETQESDELKYQEIKDYDWEMLLNKSSDWYKSTEAIELANEFLDTQLEDGGFRKYNGYWKSTIDNGATTSQIRFLAKVYIQTKNEIYKNACLKGIDLLINSQYDNGGWPQYFDVKGTFLAYVTYNDNAMINVMYIMKEVASKSGDFTFVNDIYSKNAKNALKKGIKCILDTQIIVDGERTAWAQQYDEKTLTPAKARDFELPSISTMESTYIIKFLQSIDSPSEEVKTSIDSALEWMNNVKLNGIKYITKDDDRIIEYDENSEGLWARFYEIGTNKPMFVDRDGSIHYDLMEISKERRMGYDWYGTWPNKLK